MQEFLVTEWLAMFCVCLLSALIAVRYASPGARSGGSGVPLLDGSESDPVFLFDEAGLIDSSTAAEPVLKTCSNATRWDDIRKALAPGFPGLPETLTGLRDSGPLTIGGTGRERDREAHCEWLDGVARVHLRPAVTPRDTNSGSELENLRTAMDDAPYPVWRETADGQVSWYNRAYGDLRKLVSGPGAPDSRTLFSRPAPSIVESRKSRAFVTLPETGKKLWFDVSEIQSGEGKLGYAVDINAVVDAEVAQRNFVQTLAKTFAQLSTGLAIFDRNRQLALFNPALIDLTELPADFLSSRPTLFNFFDRLRDQRVRPEPKDYNSWRRQISDLVEAAADGHYQETWSLPSGAVYSVRGRPHPDGAVAFLFEDITAEITLTRRFRAELELGQAIIDQLDLAIAVFSQTGVLSLSNKAYHSLWGVNPDTSFAEFTVVDACRVWQEKSATTTVWRQISDFVHLQDSRTAWSDTIAMLDGSKLNCSIVPIQNGATMVSFGRVGQGKTLRIPAPVLTSTD